MDAAAVGAYHASYSLANRTLDVMFSGASFLGGYVNGNDPTAMADSVRTPGPVLIQVRL